MKSDTNFVYPNYHSFSTCLLTSIKENTIDDVISIHPNPTSGLFSINLNESKSGALRLFNSLGQVVMTREFEGARELSINLEEPPGIYFLRLEIDGELITRKIVKE